MINSFKQSKRYSIVLLFLLALVFSCKKEHIQPSPAEVTAKELQAVISDSNIKRVIPVDYNSTFPSNFSQNAGTSFSFSNGYLKISGFRDDAYNLDKVKSYSITNVSITNNNGGASSIEKVLVVYFY